MNIRKASYMLLPFLLLSGCSNKESTSIPSSENPTTEDNKVMYQYGDKEKYQNFLKDSIIYNEIVTLVEEDGEIYGKLLYEPKEIISIRDYSLEKEYEITDYRIEGKKIIRAESSNLPYFTGENMKGENLQDYGISTMDGKEPGNKVMFTEGPGIVMHTINVTYTHEDRWTLDMPSYKGNELPKTINKLKNKEHLTVGFYGDSIMTGCNSSGKLAIPPYLDDFPTASVEMLKSYYGYDDIESFNSSKGGMLSDWGVTNVDSLVNTNNPDLVFVGFGMNDGSWKIPSAKYVSQIEDIIARIQAHNQDVEIVVVATILANPDATQNQLQESYLSPLTDMVNQYDGVTMMDMTTYSKNMLHFKRSVDLYANNINHPNDFMVRGYVSNILSLLVEKY